MLRSALLVLIQLASLRLNEHFILLLRSDPLVDPVLLLFLKDAGVLPLTIHLLFTLNLLKLSLLLHFVHILPPSDLAMLFFPLLIDLSHTFFLFHALFGLLSHVIPYLVLFFLIPLSTHHVLLSLDLQHVCFI